MNPGDLLAHLPRPLPGGGVTLLLQPRVAPLLDLLPVLHLLGRLEYGSL